MKQDAIAIIPARFASTRFPGKPLACETGRPLIQHVYEQAAQANVSRVIVATDDERIAAAVRAFGGEALMTRADHPNGTMRIAEVAAGLDAPFILNVQGDEPEIDLRHIDAAIDALRSAAAGGHTAIVASTLAAPFEQGEEPRNPNIVKVVTDRDDCALYFSRALIPHDRDATGIVPPRKHVGLYVYRRAFLLEYPSLPTTPLERAENLEQLRILEHGRRIRVATVTGASHGIDTPEQYRAFVDRWRKGGNRLD